MSVHTITRRAPEGPNSLAEYEQRSRSLHGFLGSAFDITPGKFPQITFEEPVTTYGPAAPIPTEAGEAKKRDWSAFQAGAERVAETGMNVLAMTHRERMARQEASARRAAAESAERRAAMERDAALEERAWAERHGAPSTALGIPLLLGGAALVLLLMNRN